MAENPDLIREVYGAWNAGEIDRFGDYFAPDARYLTSGLFPGFDRVYVGPEGMRRFHDEMLSAWERFHIEPTSIETFGDLELISVRFDGRGRSRGIEVTLEFEHAARIEDGRITLFAAAQTREAVLEAAARG